MIRLVGRTTTVQPGVGHSCLSAYSSMQPLQPMCPQHERITCSATGTRSVLHAGHRTVSPLHCRSRMARKYRRERTRPTSSFCRRRRLCTCSRRSHFRALRSSSAFFVSARMALSFFLCFSLLSKAFSPAAKISRSRSPASSSPQPSFPVSFRLRCQRVKGSSGSFPYPESSPQMLSNFVHASITLSRISFSQSSSCCCRVFTIPRHAALALSVLPARS
mmetsp:Transcript_40411/g.67425  ORF Transcript_40411/g.67425 Transcript_40411/m.67425 type:complete len:219 (+) Transcript_40411:1034-1690(+)